MIVTEKPDQIKVIVCEDIMLHDGLYEQIINKEIDDELSATDKLTQTSGIDSAEAAKTLSEYISEVVLRGLENIKDNGGNIANQVNLARSRLQNAPNNFSLFLKRKTTSLLLMKKQKSFDRKHPSRRAVYSPALSMNRRCTQSLKRKSSPVTALICLFPLSNGAVCD